MQKSYKVYFLTIVGLIILELEINIEENISKVLEYLKTKQWFSANPQKSM